MGEIDLRQVDGEPFEVAAAGGAVLDELFTETIDALKEFYWAARGAWLTAEDHRTGSMPRGDEFDATPQGRKINQLHENLKIMQGEARQLAAAASWNPKAL